MDMRTLRATLKGLGTFRPDVLLLFGMSMLLFAGLLGAAWVSGPSANSYPTVVYWLSLAGFRDPFHTPGFIFVLVLCALFALAGLIRALSVGGPPFKEGQLRAEIPCAVGTDRFRECAQEWGRKGRLDPLRAEGDSTLQGRRRSFSRLGLTLTYAGTLLVLAGSAINAIWGWQARVSVDDGKRVNYVQLMEGRAPASWRPLLRDGKAIQGFFAPGFEIECSKFELESYPDGAPQAYRSLLNLYNAGKLIATQTVAAGAPIRFEGMTLHQTGYGNSSFHDVEVLVTDHVRGKERIFSHLKPGQGLDVEDYQFSIIDVQPETELSGAAAEIGYQLPGKPAERFWIFERFAKYDFAHRKNSAQNFTLRSVRPRSSSELLVSREPGNGWMFAGFLGLLLGVLLASGRSDERFTLVWTGNQVIVSGESDKPRLFRATFDHELESLRELFGKGRAP